MSKWLTRLLFKGAKLDEREHVYTKCVYVFISGLDVVFLVCSHVTDFRECSLSYRVFSVITGDLETGAVTTMCY